MDEIDIDVLMNCDCDCPIVIRDAYFRSNHTLTTNWACTGCGKEISIDSQIINVYDVESKRRRRHKEN